MNLTLSRPRGAAVAAFLVLAATCALATSAARAAGTVTIQQSDGETDVYQNAIIRIVHDVLYVTSPDRVSTLVISRAACSYQGKLFVCFATKAALIKNGVPKPIDFKSGTIYLNTTDDFQSMVMTSMKVPPHGILLSFTTDRGTYINLRGRVDKLEK